MGGAVRRHLGHLPPGRAAPLADDRRPPRARAPRRTRCACRSLCRRASRSSSSSSRSRCAPSSRTSSAPARCTGLRRRRRSPTPRATSPAATLAGHGWFGLYGGLVLFESRLALLLPGRRRGRAWRPGRPPSRWGSPPRRSSRCSSCRPCSCATRAATAARPALGGRARARAPRPVPARGGRVRAGGRRDPARRADAAQRRRADRARHVGRAPGRRRLQRAADHARPAAALPGGPTSLLPHLAGLEATRGRRRVRARRCGTTMLAIAAFAARRGARAAARSARGPWSSALRLGLRLRARRAGR